MLSQIRDDRRMSNAGTDVGVAGDRAGVEVARGVFFIVGVPRSGTTLLKTMLGAHPRVCVPHETEFFMRMPAGVAGSELRRAFEAYASSVPFAQQGLEAAPLLDAIDSGRCVTRAQVFVEMARQHAMKAHKPRVGEKSPHHCRHVEAIAAELPDARFIHISRDPRDVAASGVRVPWGSRSIVAQAKGWLKVQREHQRLLGAMPRERYTEIRFEDLVRSPEQELRRVCEFLGEEYAPEMMEFAEKARAGLEHREAAWAGSTVVPLDAGAIGRYRERLSARQIRAVQRIAGAEMERLEYQPVPTPARMWWVCADLWETAMLRLKRLMHSARKRTAL